MGIKQSNCAAPIGFLMIIVEGVNVSLWEKVFLAQEHQVTL